MKNEEAGQRSPFFFLNSSFCVLRSEFSFYICESGEGGSGLLHIDSKPANQFDALPAANLASSDSLTGHYTPEKLRTI